MKFLIVVFGMSLWSSGNVYAQDVGYPKILHITSLADTSADQGTDTPDLPLIKAELIVLSLTSQDMFDHFAIDAKMLRKNYGGGKMLVAVDRDGASEKSEFMIEFYRLTLQKNGNYQEAFDEALKNVQWKYGNIHFKAAMYDLSDRK